MSLTPQSQLEQLLEKLFTQAEFRRTLEQDGRFAALRGDLPSETLAATPFFHEVTKLLDRHGLIDDDLLELLVRVRPKHEQRFAKIVSRLQTQDQELASSSGLDVPVTPLGDLPTTTVVIQASERAFLERFPHREQLRETIKQLLTRMPHVKTVDDVVLQERGGQSVNWIAITADVPLSNRPELWPCLVCNFEIPDPSTDPQSTIDAMVRTLCAIPMSPTKWKGSSRGITALIPSRVIVITPYSVHRKGEQAIRDRTRSERFSLQFIDSNELMRCFRDYWPEVLEDEVAATDRYLAQMQEAIREDIPVAEVNRRLALYDADEVRERAPTVFVMPTFELTLVHVVLKARLSLLIPDVQLLDQKLSISVQAAVDAKLNQFTRFLRRITSLVPTPALYALIDMVEALQHLLLAHWNPAKSRPRTERLLLGSVEDNAQSDVERFADRNAIRVARRPREWFAQNATALRAACEAAEEDIAAYTSAVGDFCNRHVTLSRRLLASEELAEVCMRSGFLSSLSSTFLAERSRKTYRVSLEDLLGSGGSFMVAAPPGAGKSTFCRHAALGDVQGYLSRRGRQIPVFIPLHRLHNQDIRSFDELTACAIHRSVLLRRQGDQTAARSGSVETMRVYLDGLDEVPEIDRQKAIARIVREKLEGGDSSRIQVILTAREHVRGPWLNWLPRFSLAPMDDAGLRSLAMQWIGDPGAADDFMGQLNAQSALRQVLGSPLLATLTVLVYRHRRNLPENRNRLYEIFFELLLQGWDLAKGVHRLTIFGFDEKASVLRSLAWHVHRGGVRSFDDDQLRGSIRRVRGELSAVDETAFLHELIVSGLIVRLGPKELRFAHLSYQEFLAAREVHCSANPERAVELLRNYLRSPWWSEVFHFFLAMLTPMGALEFLRREAPKLLKGDKNQQSSAGFEAYRIWSIGDLERLVKVAHPWFASRQLRDDEEGEDNFEEHDIYLDGDWD